LITKETRPDIVAADRARYEIWTSQRTETRDRAAQPSLTVVTTTEYVKGERRRSTDGGRGVSPVERAGFSPAEQAVAIFDTGLAGPRPTGRRFGVLVHALLAAVPLDAPRDAIDALALLHARVLGAPDEERQAATMAVERALTHDVLQAARAAITAGRSCRREAPISIMRDGVLIDGQIDLAFDTDTGWTVVDFKTDVELGAAEDVYRRQVALYAEALAAITGTPAEAVILRV
jgi:ATP-dependent exoDNAse (exonuclease V) beta subunit